MFSFHNME